MRCRGWAVLMGVVVIGLTAYGTEYWVSPTGDDSNPGTFVLPWASPSRGASARVNGYHAPGSMTLAIRDASGFLASGTLNVAGLGSVTYTSIANEKTFQLASGLSSGVNDDTIVHDGDILGGNGFQPGDIITLRGGTYSQKRLRLKASGTTGNPITYRSYAGESPYLYIANLQVGGQNVGGVVWTDGSEQSVKTEYVVIEGLQVKADQNFGAGQGHAVVMGAANAVTFRNMHITSTGSGGDLGYGIFAYKCYPLIVTNCTIWSKYERAIGLAGGGTVQIDNSVIGGAKYGLLNTAGTIAANHVTIVEMPNLAYHCEAAGTLRNSIVIGCAGTVLSRGSGDYIDVFNSGATPYSGTWNGGSGAGPNDISLDPEFMLGGFAQDDPNRFDPTWLRYPWSSPAAEAGEDGTYLGAFPPYGTKPAVGSVITLR